MKLYCFVIGMLVHFVISHSPLCPPISLCHARAHTIKRLKVTTHSPSIGQFSIDARVVVTLARENPPFLFQHVVFFNCFRASGRRTGEILLGLWYCICYYFLQDNLFLSKYLCVMHVVLAAYLVKFSNCINAMYVMYEYLHQAIILFEHNVCFVTFTL